MNMKKNFGCIALLALSGALVSCGVEVTSESYSYDTHDYVSLDLSYIDDFGDRTSLKQECIDLDGPSKSETISITNHDVGHTLQVKWKLRGDAFTLRFLEDGLLLHSTFYDTDRFREYRNAKVNFEVDYVDYQVNLSGGGC